MMFEGDKLWLRAMKELGHDPILKENGDLNMFVLDGDHHNGPGCASCGLSWCEHCVFDPTKIGPCDNPVIEVNL